MIAFIRRHRKARWEQIITYDEKSDTVIIALELGRAKMLSEELVTKIGEQRYYPSFGNTLTSGLKRFLKNKEDDNA